MPHLPWYLTAIGAALVWGLHYPLIEQALRRVSLATVLAFTTVPFVLLLPLLWDLIGEDLRRLAGFSWRERLPVLLLPVTTLSASLLLFLSIRGSNATLASLIEITYPLFVVLFSWLLFREHELTPGVALGGVLILAGTATVIFSSR
jgi:drug/metabolite transporter (DMT)-like permease